MTLEVAASKAVLADGPPLDRAPERLALLHAHAPDLARRREEIIIIIIVIAIPIIIIIIIIIVIEEGE